MEGTAVRRRLTWQTGTVGRLIDETPTVRTIELQVADWAGHRAGQHLDVRLTAEDGYRAERSYSIASAPGEPVAITVERLEDGEVSPYLTEELQVGDELELRGPIGGYFVWDGDHHGGPLMLLAGGSGIAPFRSILRYRERSGSTVPTRLLYSSRSLPDVIYRGELDRCDGGVEVIYTLTRQHPTGWTGHVGRVDAALLAKIAWPAGQDPTAFVCGPTSFVETVAEGLVGLGYLPPRVKTERFGATGGPDNRRALEGADGRT
jgi:ferredoxin-NADP reductase